MLTAIRSATERLFDALREARLKRRERGGRFQVALGFNKSNTFTDTRPSLWMCPTCLRTHAVLERSSIDGPVYPACCEHERGGRKQRRHATGLRF